MIFSGEGRRTVVRVFAKTDDKNPPPISRCPSQQNKMGAASRSALNIGPNRFRLICACRYQHNFNIELPLAWLSGQVQLEAMVDADNVEPEFNESNNVYTQTLTSILCPLGCYACSN